jgi:hypothetical protein
MEFYHDFIVEQKGRMIYLVNKQTNKAGTPDTVARITLNEKGRAISCAANSELDPDAMLNPAVTEYYIYKNDRVIAVRSDYKGLSASIPHEVFEYTIIDSLTYDKYGNILTFNHNSYQYDYNRKAKQQFYCDDFMGSDEPFYVLQYLGFFPEVNCPPNVRTLVETEVFSGDLSNHRFDSKGRLIGYNFYLPITITWK